MMRYPSAKRVCALTYSELGIERQDVIKYAHLCYQSPDMAYQYKEDWLPSGLACKNVLISRTTYELHRASSLTGRKMDILSGAFYTLKIAVGIFYSNSGMFLLGPFASKVTTLMSEAVKLMGSEVDFVLYIFAFPDSNNCTVLAISEHDGSVIMH